MRKNAFIITFKSINRWPIGIIRKQRKRYTVNGKNGAMLTEQRASRREYFEQTSMKELFFHRHHRSYNKYWPHVWNDVTRKCHRTWRENLTNGIGEINRTWSQLSYGKRRAELQYYGGREAQNTVWVAKNTTVPIWKEGASPVELFNCVPIQLLSHTMKIF